MKAVIIKFKILKRRRLLNPPVLEEYIENEKRHAIEQLHEFQRLPKKIILEYEEKLRIRLENSLDKIAESNKRNYEEETRVCTMAISL